MDVLSKVKELIVEQLSVEANDVEMKTSFEELEADSLDIVELVMAIEEEFELEIADEEVEQIKTVGDVVKYIEANL